MADLASFLVYMYEQSEPLRGILITIGFLTFLLLGRRLRKWRRGG
jgi:hypothetical protein